MTNISLFDPQNQQSRLNRLIRHMGLNSPTAFDEANELKALTLNLDVSEDDENYWVHADLPGAKKNDIRVSVDGNQVTIVAEIKSRIEERKERNVIHSERYQGRVTRNFSLDSNIDESRTIAKFNDGVLELTLPKRSGSNGRKQISIQ